MVEALKRNETAMSPATARACAKTCFAAFGLLAAAAFCQAEVAPPVSKNDGAWTRAIVKIEVPIVRSVNGYPRHFLERCSGTIVSPGPFPLVISAWHCFEGHNAMSSPVTLQTGAGPTAIELVASGGSMDEDWALLRSTSKWWPGKWIPVSQVRVPRGSRVSAAGFSRPSGSIALESDDSPERILTIDEDCRVTLTSSRPLASSCAIQKGASGGAILGRTQSGSLRLYGIISAGDGTNVSYFYPADLLSPLIRP